MKRWIKQLLWFGDIWVCEQCDSINMEGRWYCGLCGKRPMDETKPVVEG
jgi:hypothetical protein